jgi:hypothetical protein
LAFVAILRPVDRGIARRAITLFTLTTLIGLVVALGIPVCPSATLFGIPCPGCGLTRATLAALHGDFAAALRFHPLVFVLTPLLGLLAARGGYGYIRGWQLAQNAAERSFWTARATSIAAGALVLLMLGVWGARFVGYFGGPAPVETLRAKISTSPK